MAHEIFAGVLPNKPRHFLGLSVTRVLGCGGYNFTDARQNTECKVAFGFSLRREGDEDYLGVANFSATQEFHVHLKPGKYVIGIGPVFTYLEEIRSELVTQNLPPAGLGILLEVLRLSGIDPQRDCTLHEEDLIYFTVPSEEANEAAA